MLVVTRCPLAGHAGHPVGERRAAGVEADGKVVDAPVDQFIVVGEAGTTVGGNGDPLDAPNFGRTNQVVQAGGRSAARRQRSGRSASRSSHHMLQGLQGRVSADKSPLQSLRQAPAVRALEVAASVKIISQRMHGRDGTDVQRPRLDSACRIRWCLGSCLTLLVVFSTKRVVKRDRLVLDFRKSAQK